MKRLILLSLPVVAFAVGPTDSADPPSREEITGRLWQESIGAETSGDATAAKEKLTAYAQSGGDPYLANLRAGWLNSSAKNDDEAARNYAAAAKIHPNAISPRLGLLSLAQAKGDVAAAASAGENVLKIEPTNYRALMAVAWGAFQAKDYSRSNSTYRRVLLHYPEDTDALSGAAWCTLYTGQKSEAKALFRRLMSLNPNAPYVRQGLAATAR